MIMSRTNWYFEGWKKQGGRWEYHGVRYRFQAEESALHKLKVCYGAAALAMILIWLVCSVLWGVGKETSAYVGAPWFLQILPFMYLIMGVYGILRSGYDMTYRDLRAGFFRIRIAKWVLLILQAASVIGELVFLILYHSVLPVSEEILFMAGACLCILCTAVLLFLQYRYPPYQIPE